MMRSAVGFAKHVLLCVVLMALAADGFAQDGSLYLSGRRQPVHVSFTALYQTYSEDANKISEFSTPLFISVPVGRNLGLSLVASQASATGDTLVSVSGLSDAQVGLSYYQRIGQGSVVMSFGVNLPSGKRELTTDEFETTVFLSRHVYNFRVPGFGQGLNLSPGIVAAIPVSENVVLGVGVSYQLKGGYKPQDGMEEDYNPGDELLLTGGMDVRVGHTSNLSADVTYTQYGSDALGDTTVFNAGDKVTATLQFLTYFGIHDLRLVARYRSQSKSNRPAVFGASEAELRTLPAQTLLLGRYRHHVSPTVVMGGLVQARFFGETDFFDAKTLFDVGFAPEVTLSRQVVLQTRFLYTLGDFSGFEIGGGLSLDL